MKDDHLELGISLEDGSLVTMTPAERKQGTYLIGTTGTGKSTLIRNMIFQDMHPSKREGLCLLDPHGDLIDEILGLIPNVRAEDVILFDPMDTECPIGLNLRPGADDPGPPAAAAGAVALGLSRRRAGMACAPSADSS